jgi:hypothetical protein
LHYYDAYWLSFGALVAGLLLKTLLFCSVKIHPAGIVKTNKTVNITLLREISPSSIILEIMPEIYA